MTDEEQAAVQAGNEEENQTAAATMDKSIIKIAIGFL